MWQLKERTKSLKDFFFAFAAVVVAATVAAVAITVALSRKCGNLLERERKKGRKRNNG